MAPSSPTKRHPISVASTNPLLSNFSMLSLDQQAPLLGNNNPSRPSSRASPSKASKSSHPHPHLRTSSSKTSLGGTSHARLATAGSICRDEMSGRDVVKKDWSASPSKKTSTSSAASRKAPSGDRYIPRDVDGGALDLNSREHSSSTGADPAYATEISSALGIDLNARILTFSADVPTSLRVPRSSRDDASSKERAKLGTSAARRTISTMPERVLDAPGLIDDYYLNLCDWSSENVLAIALSESVYLWNASAGSVSCLCSLEEPNYYASVKFSLDGLYLALGTSDGTVQIYDVEEARLLRKMTGRENRVASLSWSGTTLSAGGLDGSIWNHDVQAAQHKASEMIGHRAEVCGLAWKPEIVDGFANGSPGLLASGANDNIVNVWDARNVSEPRMSKNNHRAAVKAIAWCPWQSNMLATGGGTSDKMIHFWNVNTSSRLQSLETRSQVTSIVFNPYAREFLSTHGMPDMHFAIHTFPNFALVGDVQKAHETRILHSALSPDGTIVVTASSDENLKFWRVFENKKAKALPNAPFGRAHPLGTKDQNQEDLKGGFAVR